MALKLLQRVEYLKHLPPSELKRIMKLTQVINVPAGHQIFSKSEAGNQMFIVADGRIKIHITSTGRKHKTLAYLEKGDFFGEMSLLDGRVRSASATAVDDSRLLVVSKSDFKKLLSKDPRFSFLIMRTLAERLRKTDEEVENLLFKNLLGRLAKALLDLASRQPDGNAVRLTHQELADLIGTSREPLTRALGVLKRRGVIESGEGKLVVTSVERLKQIVGT